MKLIFSFLIFPLMCAAQVDFPTPVTIYPKADGSEAGSLKILKADGTCCAFEFKGVSTEATTFGSFRIVSTTGDPRATMSASGLLLFYGGGGNSITINRNGASVWFYEHPDNGTDYIEVKAPDLLAAPYTFRFPSGAGTNTHCLKTDGTGATYWDACAGAGSLPVVDSTAIVKDDGDNTKLLRFEASLITTGTTRALSAQDANYTIAGLETAQTFTALNQFTVNRPAGHTLFNRNTAVDGISGPAFFDDGGTARGGVGWRNASDGVGPNSITLHTFGAHPVQFATNNTVRAFVDDTGFRPAGSGYHLGSAADPWNTSYQRYNFNWGTYIAPELSSSFAGNWRLFVVSPPFPAFVINDNSATETFRINSSPREVVLNGTLKPNGIQNIGTVGGPWENAYIKNLTVSGVCTGCGDAPFSDATAILRDDADATKLLRFELGGLSTATTRILTPQNASYTIAGTNISQTFSANQTFAGHLFPSGAVDIGQNGGTGPFNAAYFKFLYSYELRVAPDPGSGGTFSGAWKFSSAAGLNPFIILDDNAGNTVFQVATNPRRFTFRGDLMPNAAGTYNIGASGDRWPKAWLTDLDTSGNSTITIGSGNFYLRHFSGGDASCAGVANGWMGIRTDTNELQVCIGSAMKKVSLL